MDSSAIVTAIDTEIDRLKQARNLLTGIGTTSVPTLTKRAKVALHDPKRKKRVLSEEARAKIAAGQKRRWAASKAAK